MIPRLMNPDTQQPGNTGRPPRSADMYDALAWLEMNKMKVGVIAVIAVLIGFALATTRYLRQQKELNASTALLALRPALTPSTNVPAPQAAAFLEVANEFSGTDAAERARFLAASTLFQEGKYAEAEGSFQEFIQAHPNSPWAAAAAFGQAASLEALNKTNEAMAAYQQIATAYGNSAVVDDAKLAIARIYETRGEPQEALRVYSELSPAAGEAPGNPQAQQRREALLMAHPNLGTNQSSGLAPAPVQITPSTSSAPAAVESSAGETAGTNAAASPEPAAEQ